MKRAYIRVCKSIVIYMIFMNNGIISIYMIF